MSLKTKLGIKGTLASLSLLVVGLGVFRSWDTIQKYVGKPRTEITFWNGFTGPDGRTMLEMIRDFNAANPDVHVSMQRMDWATYYNKLMVAAMDGRGPQLFVVHASTLPRMTRAGYIGDVANLYQGPNAIPPNDFDPYVLQQVKFGETYVGVPLDIHPQGMYSNAEVLREKGFVNAEGKAKPPATKEEFMRALRTITEPTKDSNGQTKWAFALTFWRNNYQTLIPQFGGRYLDEQGNSDLNNPGNVAALEFLGSLSKEKLIPPPENGLGWVGYRQKKVAMVWDGVYMLGDLLRLQGMEYIASPIPQIGPKPGTMADSHVLCIRKVLTPEQRSGAERFVTFLSANSIRWAGAGQVPARRSIRELPEFKQMQVQSAFAKQIPYMLYPARTPVLFEMQLEIDLAVEKVIRGRSDAQSALDLADKNAQKAMDRDRKEEALRTTQKTTGGVAN